MTLPSAVTELDALRTQPAVARLLAWNSAAVAGAKLDREELSIYIERSHVREAALILRDDPELRLTSSRM
jgi:hypothetical protein